MFTQKQMEKYKRTKYTRELERFLNRIVGYVSKNDELRKEDFSNYIDLIFEPLENIEKVLLNSPYLTHLEKFVEKIANLPLSDMEMDEIRKEILHGANQLQKTKRRQNKNSIKHKGKLYDR